MWFIAITLLLMISGTPTSAEEPIPVPAQVIANPVTGSFAVAALDNSPSHRISPDAMKLNRTFVLIHRRYPSTYSIETGVRKKQFSTVTSKTKQNTVHLLVRMNKIYFRSDVIAAHIWTSAPGFGSVQRQRIDIYVTHPNGKQHMLTEDYGYCNVVSTRASSCIRRLNKPEWFSSEKDIEVTVRAQIRDSTFISSDVKLTLAKNPSMSFGSDNAHSSGIWAELPPYDLIRSTTPTGATLQRQTVFPVRIWTNAWSKSATSWEVVLKHDPVFETTGWDTKSPASPLFEKVRAIPNGLESEFFDVKKDVKGLSKGEFSDCCLTRVKVGSGERSLAILRKLCCKSSTTTLTGTIKAGSSPTKNPTLLATLWIRASELLEDHVQWVTNHTILSGYLPFEITRVKLAAVESSAGYIFTPAGKMKKIGFAAVSVPFSVGLHAFVETLTSTNPNNEQELVNMNVLGAVSQFADLTALEIYSCHTVEVSAQRLSFS